MSCRSIFKDVLRVQAIDVRNTKKRKIIAVTLLSNKSCLNSVLITLVQLKYTTILLPCIGKENSRN